MVNELSPAAMISTSVETFTVTLAVLLFPNFGATVTTALPFPTAVILPLLSTFATEGLLDVNTKSFTDASLFNKHVNWYVLASLAVFPFNASTFFLFNKPRTSFVLVESFTSSMLVTTGAVEVTFTSFVTFLSLEDTTTVAVAFSFLTVTLPLPSTETLPAGVASFTLYLSFLSLASFVMYAPRFTFPLLFATTIVSVFSTFVTLSEKAISSAYDFTVTLIFLTFFLFTLSVIVIVALPLETGVITNLPVVVTVLFFPTGSVEAISCNEEFTFTIFLLELVTLTPAGSTVSASFLSHV